MQYIELHVAGASHSIVPYSLIFFAAALVSIFVIPSLAFLLILPGVKRTKAISALCFLSSMFTGSTLLGNIVMVDLQIVRRVSNALVLLLCSFSVGLRYPCWQIAEVRIYSQYKAFSNDRMDALLGVKIGLETVNITLSSQFFISYNHNSYTLFHDFD